MNDLHEFAILRTQTLFFYVPIKSSDLFKSIRCLHCIPTDLKETCRKISKIEQRYRRRWQQGFKKTVSLFVCRIRSLFHQVYVVNMIRPKDICTYIAYVEISMELGKYRPFVTKIQSHIARVCIIVLSVDRDEFRARKIRFKLVGI